MLTATASNVSMSNASISESTEAQPAQANLDTEKELEKSDLITQARIKGYEGVACDDCGNFTMVRNGTCLKCDTCGATSGCS